MNTQQIFKEIRAALNAADTDKARELIETVDNEINRSGGEYHV